METQGTPGDHLSVRDDPGDPDVVYPRDEPASGAVMKIVLLPIALAVIEVVAMPILLSGKKRKSRRAATR